MKPWAMSFYYSRAWQDTRAAYLDSVGGICERCAKRGEVIPAIIVHHRQHLTRENIRDPKIALCWDNLEALCMDCHNKEHMVVVKARRYSVDANGDIRPIPPILLKSGKG